MGDQAAAPMDEVLALSKINGRVCPMPIYWNELWELLPNRTRDGAGWLPPLPLILAAWHYASNDQKSERLWEHIAWAARHDVLPKILEFLQALPEHHWHHKTD